MLSADALRRLLLVPAAALALGACGGKAESAGGIPREKFVAANVAVRTLPDDATPEQRAAALRKHGVTDKQLKAWVNGNARQPRELAKAWEEIAFKVDSLGGAAMHTPVTPTPGAPPPSNVPPVRRERGPGVRIDTMRMKMPPAPVPGSADPRPLPPPVRRPGARVQ